MKKRYLFTIVFLSLLYPFIVFSAIDKCFVGETCSYEVENCTDGLLIGINCEGTPLEIPIIEDIPPMKINLIPKREGKIKMIYLCFEPFVFKKEKINVEEKPLLSCPSKCKTTENCRCDVFNCTDGLFVLINKKGTPVDYSAYSPVDSVSSPRYSYSFIPGEEGRVKAIALCFSPEIRFEKAIIEIEKKIQTCSQLGGSCCPSGKICIQDRMSGAADCSECCGSLDFCKNAVCKPGTCDQNTRKFCLPIGDWSSRDSKEYCENCSHCSDHVCNCGENCSTCEEDCGACRGNLIFSNCVFNKSKGSITCETNCEFVEGKETIFTVIDKKGNIAQVILDGLFIGSFIKIGNKVEFFPYPLLSNLDSDSSSWVLCLNCWNPRGTKYVRLSQ